MLGKFNTFFLISFFLHLGILLYDVIDFKLNFKFNFEEQKKIETIINNTKIVEKGTHAKEQKELLERYFKEENNKVYQEAKKRFLKDQNSQTKLAEAKEKEPVKVKIKGVGQGDEEEEKKHPLADLLQDTYSQGGGSFQSALKKNPEELATSTQKGLIYRAKAEFPRLEADDCKGGQKYVGLGFAIEMPGVSEVTYKNKIPWKINELAEGHIAHRSNMKTGDVFLGVINTEGRFFEGNTFLAEKYPKGTWVKLLWKSGNELIEKDVQLEEICYYPNKSIFR